MERELMEAIANMECIKSDNRRLKNLLVLIFNDKCAKVMSEDLYNKLKEELNVTSSD